MSDQAKTFIVYMATNTVNGKRYVGMTGQAFEKRKERHLYYARINSDGCQRFYDAIRKYGELAFEWEVVAANLTKKHAIETECRLISEIKSVREEYNVTNGGEGAFRNSTSPYPEVARETHRKNGIKNKHIWERYRHLGPLAHRRKVVCLNTGAIYSSIKEAAAAHGVLKSLIIEVCQRNVRRKTAGGLVFRYFGDHEGGVEEAAMMLVERDAGRKIGGLKCAKSLRCDTYGLCFSGAAAASNEFCIDRQAITAVCRGERASAFGLKFSYVGER